MARALFGLLVVAALGVTGYYTYSYVHHDGCCPGEQAVSAIKRSCCGSEAAKPCCSESSECASPCSEAKAEEKKSCCEGKEGSCCEGKEGGCCKDKKDEAKKDDGKKE